VAWKRGNPVDEKQQVAKSEQPLSGRGHDVFAASAAEEVLSGGDDLEGAEDRWKKRESPRTGEEVRKGPERGESCPRGIRLMTSDLVQVAPRALSRGGGNSVTWRPSSETGGQHSIKS